MREFAADPPVEEHVGDLLRDADATIATAESCTGGLISSLLTDVPGASDYLDRAVCTYSYEAKMTLLGVPREVLDREGAVSDPVARQMARAARDTARTTWGVSTTGIAGPTGGSDEKPVGTAFIAVAHQGAWDSGETETRVTRYEFDGSRLEIKEQIARQALRDVETAIERRNK